MAGACKHNYSNLGDHFFPRRLRHVRNQTSDVLPPTWRQRTAGFLAAETLSKPCNLRPDGVSRYTKALGNINNPLLSHLLVHTPFATDLKTSAHGLFTVKIIMSSLSHSTLDLLEDLKHSLLQLWLEAQVRGILDRCHSWNRCAICGSLPRKSISQAPSEATWLPNHRKSSRAKGWTMGQVRRVAEDVRLVCRDVLSLFWSIFEIVPTR